MNINVRLEEIKNNTNNLYMNCEDRYQANKDFNWLYETVKDQQKEIERLQTIEQAYNALLKAM